MADSESARLGSNPSPGVFEERNDLQRFSNLGLNGLQNYWRKN